MKIIIIFLSICFFSLNLIAQTPEKISYQAVIRDQNNLLVNKKPIGVKISILRGSVSGNPIYIEIFNPNPTTNDNGLLTLEIGSGISLLGKFSDIDWANGAYFIKSEADPSGGTNYSIIGVSQMLSVPYAIHAKSASQITGELNESDPIYNKSVASSISTTNITNWNNSFSWGNHANAGYLKSFTELDPIWKASPSFNITNENISNWNTSFGWGNHANSGYLKSFTEIDPLWKASPSSNITIDNITNWNNKQSKIIAGNNITLKGDTINSTGVIKLNIGNYYQGGIIFWLDSSGQHGLVAATSDQSSNGVLWNHIPFVGQSRPTHNTSRNGIGAGLYNTERICIALGENTYAAQLCATYNFGDFGDWYLPSIYELSLLYNQKNVVGGFTSGIYWSSNENGGGSAKNIDFSNGNISSIDTKYGNQSSGIIINCRAIRRF